MNYPTSLQSLTQDNCGQPLVCSGCAHSAARAPFPGHPSGERPCFFCIRNVHRETWCAEHFKTCPGAQNIDGKVVNCIHPAHGIWYGGEKVFKSPMDCYCSCDMKRQQHLWQGGNAADVLLG